MADRELRELRDRVTRLEAELSRLQSRLDEALGETAPWWKRIAGNAKGDKTFAAIVREMRKNRAAERAAAVADSKTPRPPGRRRKKLVSRES